MIVGTLEADVLLHEGASLKEKRMIVKSIKDKIFKKYKVAVAEVDFLDKWQRAGLAFAAVSAEKKIVQKQLNAIFNELDNDYRFEIIRHDFNYWK